MTMMQPWLVRFAAVLLLHLLYDFHWQGPFVAEMKGKRPFILLVHALTWALCLGAALWYLNALKWWHVPLLFASHALVDHWKASLPKTDAWWWAIYVDQALHLASMLVVTT